MNRRFLLSIAGALLISIVGCGGGSSSNSVGTANSPVVDKGAATIGATGGKLSTASGNAVVVLPASALTSNVSLTAQAGGQATANGQIVSDTVYTFGPTGTQFAMPASLTLKYDPSLIPAGGTESSLAIFYDNGTDWDLMPGSVVNTAAKTVTAPISHFSRYAVLAQNSYNLTLISGSYSGTGPNNSTAGGGFTMTIRPSGTLSVVNNGSPPFSGSGTVSLQGSTAFSASGGGTGGTAGNPFSFSFTGAFQNTSTGIHGSGNWTGSVQSSQYSGTWATF